MTLVDPTPSASGPTNTPKPKGHVEVIVNREERPGTSGDHPTRLHLLRYLHGSGVVYVSVEELNRLGSWTTMHGFQIRPDEFPAFRELFAE